MSSYFQGCQYDLKVPKAHLWKKDSEGYYLSPESEKFYDRIYQHRITPKTLTFQSDHLQILLRNQNRNGLFYINLEHILQDLIQIIQDYPSVHITIKDHKSQIDPIIWDKINQIVTPRIEYGILQNKPDFEDGLTIEIYLNYYQVWKDQKKKKWFKKTKEIPKYKSNWEIQILIHNHGLYFDNPESLMKDYPAEFGKEV